MPSSTENYPKSVLLSLPDPPKVNIDKISPFKMTTHSQYKNNPKSLISKLTHPPIVETIQNQSFRD